MRFARAVCPAVAKRYFDLAFSVLFYYITVGTVLRSTCCFVRDLQLQRRNQCRRVRDLVVTDKTTLLRTNQGRNNEKNKKKEEERLGSHSATLQNHHLISSEIVCVLENPGETEESSVCLRYFVEIPTESRVAPNQTRTTRVKSFKTRANRIGCARAGMTCIPFI